MFLNVYSSSSSSGQAAVITPRKVISGLGARRVKAVAAAKHHTVIATEAGEVFTWGSNRGRCFSDIHIAIFTNSVSYPNQLILLQRLMSMILLGVSNLSCLLVVI